MATDTTIISTRAEQTFKSATTVDFTTTSNTVTAATAAALKSVPALAVRIKTVYFTVGQRKEVAVFEDQTPSNEIKSLFSSAAEAGPHDILKMYTPQGTLVNISNRLESNRPDQPYRLELVAAHYNDELLSRVGDNLATLEQRVLELEKRMKDHSSLFPEPVQELRDQLDQLKQSLGLCRTGTTFRHTGLGRPYWNRHKCRRKTESEKRLVCEKFLHISTMTLTEEIRLCLRMPTFDNWQWEDEEILLLLQQMYYDLNLVRKFSIDPATLRKFLCQVYMNYNEVPFHNFQHCFTVSQMMYGIIWYLNLPDKIGDLEVLILLTSCICHDLDHPGFNNIYQINARTELALRYNDISPLENHHCSVAFNILEDQSANLFRSLPPDVYKTIREGMIRCILATDMARHNEILSQFNQISAHFDYDNRAHINLLCMVLIKVADISNEARPMDVAEPWLDCLLQEFYEQSDAEKLQGLPVTPFMDRDKISRPSSQCSFIGFVLLPLFEAIERLYPELANLIVNPVREALDYYKKLNEASKDTNRTRKSLEQSNSLLPNASASSDGPTQPTTATTSTSDDVDSAGVVANANDNGPPLRSTATPIKEWLSHEELSARDIKRFSFGLDAEDDEQRTFTEVEVCEKTSTFMISTETRKPLNGRNRICVAGKNNEGNSTSAFRRASLAVMAQHVNESARNVNKCRSATTSPVLTQPTSPKKVIIIEEDEPPPSSSVRDVPIVSRPASITTNGITKDAATTTSVETPCSGDSPAPTVTTGEQCELDDRKPIATKSSRDHSLFGRLKHWTERLNPMSDNKRTSSNPLADGGLVSSPSSTKKHGLARFFGGRSSGGHSSTPQPVRAEPFIVPSKLSGSVDSVVHASQSVKRNA